MELEGQITISRPRGNVEDHVSIKIYDRYGAGMFTEVKIPLAAFTEALMGLSHVECKIVTRNLYKVGKVKERKQISLKCKSGDKESYFTAIDNYLNDKHLKENSLKEEGWERDCNLNQQSSIRYEGDGNVILSFSIARYVTKQEGVINNGNH